MDVKLHQVCMNSDHMTQSVTAMLQIAKLTPHMRSHPHADRRMNQIFWQGSKVRAGFWIGSLASVGLSPAGVNPLSCVCVCTCVWARVFECVWSRFLRACQPCLSPELCLHCDTICHFILAELRQQNVLPCPALPVAPYIHTRYTWKSTKGRLLLWRSLCWTLGL